MTVRANDRSETAPRPTLEQLTGHSAHKGTERELQLVRLVGEGQKPGALPEGQVFWGPLPSCPFF